LTIAVYATPCWEDAEVYCLAEVGRDTSKRWRDVLWPIGGTILGLLAVPLAIEEYPEVFKENPWILPLSIVIVLGCWILPLLIHRRVARSIAWLISIRFVGKALAALIPIFLVGVLVFGVVGIFQFHKRHLAARLEHIRQQKGVSAAKRARVHVDSFEFVKVIPNKPLGINIFYRNDGDADMVDQHIYSLIARTAPASVPADAKIVEDALWDKFIKAPKNKPTTTHVAPAHSMGLWTTLYGEPLTASQVEWLRKGKFTIWFMGSAVYEDAIGEQATNFCTYYNGDPKVLFICSSHNGDVTPRK
jgi:hypothetical protein